MSKKKILQDGGDIQDTKDTSTIKWDGGYIDEEEDEKSSSFFYI